MTEWLSALGWVDATLLGVLLLSLLVGVVRGFVFECLSLAGWVVAWFAAQWVSPQLAPHLPVCGPGQRPGADRCWCQPHHGAVREPVLPWNAGKAVAWGERLAAVRGCRAAQPTWGALSRGRPFFSTPPTV